MAIKPNQVVTLTYTLKDPQTGELLDQSTPDRPLQFITGLGHIIPGLEREIMKMDKGESKEIFVKADDAYGQKNPEAVQEIKRSDLAHIENLEEGMTLYATDSHGHQIPVKILSVSDEKVVIDLNHPMAGKDLLFNVKILDVRDATPEELEHGHMHGEGGHHH
ncbi:MAG: peptidylprolyl isomerase [Chlorobi bacterium]|nr:peptidylprolyl isomerase [Chlorobiota bacterium]